MMDEAILIEISKRFRQMEDAIESPKLKSRYEEDRQDARDVRDATIEACRDDLILMQEAIRAK